MGRLGRAGIVLTMRDTTPWTENAGDSPSPAVGHVDDFRVR